MRIAVLLLAACSGGDAMSVDARVDTPHADDAFVCPDATFGSWRHISMVGAAMPQHVRASAWNGQEVVIVDWEFEGRISAYNPTTDTWRTVPSGTGAPALRNLAWIEAVGNKLFIWGGYVFNGGSFETRYDGGVLDLTTGEWTAVATAGAPELLQGTDKRAFASGTVVFLVGDGDPSLQPVDVAAAYDVSTQSWVSAVPRAAAFGYYGCKWPAWDGMRAVCADRGHVYRLTALPPGYDRLPTLFPDGDSNMYTVRITNTWLVLGGSADLSSPTPYSGYTLNPSTGTWRRVAPIAVSPRYEPAVGFVGGHAVFWGGGVYDAVNGSIGAHDGFAYDVATNCWKTISTDGAPQIDTRAAEKLVIGNELFIFNGYDGVILSP